MKNILTKVILVKFQKKLQKNMEKAKYAASSAAKGTGLVLGTIASGSQWIGKTPKNHTTKDKNPKEETPEEREKRIAKNAKKEGALAGASAAWQGLVDGVTTIGTDIKDTTVSAVEHKHGTEYAKATSEGFGIAGDTVVVTYRLVTVPKLWLDCGINMAVGAMSTPTALSVMKGASWKEGWLSFYDSQLGWSTKWTRCKNRGLIFYDKGEIDKVTGALPFMELSGAAVKLHDKPGSFVIATHRISALVASPFCGDDKKVNWDHNTDCVKESEEWIRCINSLAVVQQLLK